MSIPWSFSSGPWTVVVVANGVSSVEWTLVAVEWTMLVGNDLPIFVGRGLLFLSTVQCGGILKFSTFPLKF